MRLERDVFGTGRNKYAQKVGAIVTKRNRKFKHFTDAEIYVVEQSLHEFIFSDTYKLISEDTQRIVRDIFWEINGEDCVRFGERQTLVRRIIEKIRRKKK